MTEPAKNETTQPEASALTPGEEVRASEVEEGNDPRPEAEPPAKVEKPERGQRSERSRSEGREGGSGGRAGRDGRDGREGRADVKPSGKGPHSQMLINYVPGEECRVAIVEDGKLEELHVEKFAQASHVGSIYVGKVVNVEQAIQAAFVDFGEAENGFLHVTDLHPKYFPGEGDETTERVGFKTPRRERPPIQHALRRGDEVIVQVLKEGVGTKGPTVTSYLSIPGRFLVMMPGMDRVGVSRKVEDEDQRRKMREILDQLDLPEGFGFILRTAGFARTKAELKRDLAYLMRLWKDMDRRLKTGGKPRLLYSESDLLVRSLRDLLSNEVNEVVIDHEAAMRRAARFMKIVAPRTTTKLLHYPGTAPVFHAFGIERQIELIHAREVPLPSGGRLVIDQTEALVAIDVNSGKSRDSRDSETNAYQTNIEAVDEICRQLRLRDMGGIVVNDLIDMREARHRKDIENRVKDRLKRDRAKTTIATISEFGILEMTRQRMRPSHESVHFTDCPMCRGRGMLQKPESVAADALRELSAILDAARVAKVELVVGPRVAGELLSSKRALLGRIERKYGKHVDVRVSEAVPADRVTFYAYDAQGSDIDVTNLPIPKRPRDLVAWAELEVEAGERDGLDPADAIDDDAGIDDEPEDTVEELPIHPIEIEDTEEYRGPASPASSGTQGGGRGGPTPQGGSLAQGGQRAGDHRGDGGGGGGGGGADGEGGRRRRRRRRRGRGGAGGGTGGGGGGQGVFNEGGGDAGQSAPSRGTGAPSQPAMSGGSAGFDDGSDGASSARDGDENADGFDGADGVDGSEGGERGPDGEPQSMPPRLGPDGQPLPDGEGGRRRRRRRRRGRGRGGQGGDAAQGDSFAGGQRGMERGPDRGLDRGPDRGPSRGPDRDASGRPRVDGTPETGGEWGDNEPLRIRPPSQARAAEARDTQSGEGVNASEERGVYESSPEIVPLTPASEIDAEAQADRYAMEKSVQPVSPDADAGSVDEDDPDDGPDGADVTDGQDGVGPEGAPGSSDGTKRRRRRRRRGRRRGGAGPDGGGAAREGSGGGERPPAREQARDAREPRPPAREARPAPKAPSPPPPITPKPSASAPGASGTPKVRTLYGAARRKLSPAELNKRPKPE